jgi:hypothetical protein
LRKKTGGRIHSKFLDRKLKEADITDITLLSIDDVHENLRNAWQRYRCLKKSAANDRSTWIEDLAMARAREGKTNIASEIKSLMIREMQRREARIIKAANAEQQRLGLSMIKIQQGNEWIELTEKQEMEKALFQELQDRFNQAKHTPFCSSLLDEIGPLGISGNAQDILEGSYKLPETCDPWAAKLIPHLTYAFPPIKFPMDHSEEDHTTGWNKVRERTSSGISGLTIPQMKAHLLDEYNVQVDTIFARLPYTWGFSPDRWHKGIDVMLEKRKVFTI